MSKSIGAKLRMLKEFDFFGKKDKIFLNISTIDQVVVKNIGVTFTDFEQADGSELIEETFLFLDKYDFVCYL